jgi:hypothetical protein
MSTFLLHCAGIVVGRCSLEADGDEQVGSSMEHVEALTVISGQQTWNFRPN